MKVKFLLSSAIALFCCSLIMAKTITVSNNANSPGQFTNVQTAINDAGTTAGDIILIQGSPTNYTDFTVSKSLKIYGAGVFPNTPSGTRSVVSTLSITANNVTISGMYISNTLNVGSSGAVTGTRIEFNSITSVLSLQNSSSNTIILNNRIANISIPLSISNTLILNNVLGRIASTNSGGTYTNIVVKNNIFRTGTDATVNITYGSSEAFESWNNASGLQVFDNIFYKPTLGLITTSTFSNNIFTTITSTTVGANGNTNVNNAFGISQPHGNNFNGSESLPANYNLGPTGIAVTSSDGTEVGVNGGGVTFAMKGEAPLPYIRPVFNVTPVIIASGGTLNVTVTATASNQ